MCFMCPRECPILLIISNSTIVKDMYELLHDLCKIYKMLIDFYMYI